MSTTDLVHQPAEPPVPRHAPVDGLLALRQALLALDDQRIALEAQGDLEALAWGLDAIRAVARDLSILAKDTEGSVARVMPTKEEIVEGLGTLTSRATFTPAKWRSEALLAHLVRMAMFDHETGELLAGSPLEAAELAVKVIAACAPVTPSMQWRSGALKEHGINPDDWREQTYKGQAVTILGGTK